MIGTNGKDIMTKTKQASALEDPGAQDIASLWPAYFPDTDFSSSDWKCPFICRLACFFATPRGHNIVSQVKNEDGIYSLPLDFQLFKKTCNMENLFMHLEQHPKEALLCMGAAIHKVMLAQDENLKMDDHVKINIRLHNYPESMITLRNLKAAYIDMLVSVHGTVTKVSTVKPLVIQMSFKCTLCGVDIVRSFPDGKFSPPPKCIMQMCKGKSFSPIRSTAKPIDFQKIRLQEQLKSENHEEGRVPRTVECELAEDLVDACIPGDIVTVTGIIRQINNFMDIGGESFSAGS